MRALAGKAAQVRNKARMSLMRPRAFTLHAAIRRRDFEGLERSL
jgi:hypothetical protein